MSFLGAGGKMGFGGGAKGAWTPLEIDSLIAWYDVSSEEGLSNEDSMTQLTDFSDNGLDLPVHSSGAPKYMTNELNGLPVVDFRGSTGGFFRRADNVYPWNDGSGGTAYPNSTDPFTVAGVVKISTGTDTSQTFFSGEDYDAPTVSRPTHYGLSHRYYNSIGGYRTIILTNGLSCIQGYVGVLSTSYRVIVCRKSSGGIGSMTRNGTVVAGGPVYTGLGGGSPTADNLNSCGNDRSRSIQIGGFIGNRSSGASAVSSAGNRMGEVIYCNQEVSTEDRQKLEGYLAHKWGLVSNLPADHPYKTDPP